MPIYEYKCECGEKVEALVRGREPITGDEAGHFCATPGKLTRLLSTFSVGGSGASFGYDSMTGAACETAGGEGCGSCGMSPETCGYDN